MALGARHLLTAAPWPYGDRHSPTGETTLISNFHLTTMPKPRHKVHEVDEEVLQGVWTWKTTNRGVKIVHSAVPGVQGPPSPSKQSSSPSKPSAHDSTAHFNDGCDPFEDYNTGGTDNWPLGWGQVISGSMPELTCK